MNAVPIREEWLADDARRVVYGATGDPTGPIRPAEAVVCDTFELSPGATTRAVTFVLVPSEEELELLNRGGFVRLVLLGGHVPPFEVDVVSLDTGKDPDR